MIRYSKMHSKMLGLFGIAAIAPLALSTSANAQIQLERPQIELTPNCEVIDCGWVPRARPPRIVVPDPTCTPLFCTRPELEVERIELERIPSPALEDAVRQGELQNTGRLRQVKFDDGDDYYRTEPIQPEVAYGSSMQKPQRIDSFLKFDE